MRDNSEQPQAAQGSEAATDGALVEAWRAGDGAALEVLVRRYQTPVYRLLLRATADPASAEDLMQKAFLKAIQRIGRLRTPDAFRSWLFRLALNLARNRRRNAFRWRSASEDALVHTAAAHDPADEALHLERQKHAMRRAVEGLPRLQREVVRLRLDAELPFKEIAEILGTTEASAKVSYHHAVRALRGRLGSEP